MLTVTVTLVAKTKWEKGRKFLGAEEGHSWWPLVRGLHLGWGKCKREACV